MVKDTRDKLWGRLERAIQLRAEKKDRRFRLVGKWKQFVRKQSGFKVFRVDSEWIHNNVCAYFGHGGHGWVFEFIPRDEIWIASHHHYGRSDIDNCHCRVRTKNQKVSESYFDSTVLHEIRECKEMKKGMAYWPAHQIALEEERRAGLLADPFDDR